MLMANDDFVRPQGRRTIRRAFGLPSGPGNPMVPVDGRPNRNIRMWDIGDGKPGSTIERLRHTYHGSLASVDRLEARKIATQKSGKFTPAGVADDVTSFVLGNSVPVFKQGRNAIDAARREVKELRDKIKLQPPNSGDIVGALRRREMREFLRGMNPKDRNSYISKNRENMDPDMALAIVEMPVEFSGVLESERDQLIDTALRAQHGQAMDELVELERAIEIAESVVETGRDEVRQETGLSQHDFDERAAPFERKAEGPKHWLKKSVENGKEEIRIITEGPTGIGKNVGLSSRVATPEEVESGEYFANVDEWRKANDGLAQ